MNRTIRKVLITLLFLVGFAILAYPFVSNWWYQNQANSRIDAYTQAVSQEDPATYDRERKRVRAYNKELVGQSVPDVFAIREGTVDAEYESMLNVLGDQMMGSVEIPAIGVNLPIYHYSTEETLLKGAGHIFGSSLPVGGKSTHAVITAHRGLPAAAMFSDLDQVRKGDQFYLHVLNRTLAYQVDRIEVVQPTETRSLAIGRGKDYVTLVTCTPYGVNTERLLVRGHRVPYDPAQAAADTGFRPLGILSKVLVAIAGVLAAVLVLFVYKRMRRRKGQEAQGAPEAPGASGGEGADGSPEQEVPQAQGADSAAEQEVQEAQEADGSSGPEGQDA